MSTRPNNRGHPRRPSGTLPVPFSDQTPHRRQSENRGDLTPVQPVVNQPPQAPPNNQGMEHQ